MKGKPTPFSLGLNNQNFIIHIEFKMFKCYFSLFPLNSVQMSQIEHKLHYSNLNIKSCVSLNIHKAMQINVYLTEAPLSVSQQLPEGSTEGAKTRTNIVK